MKSPVRLLFVVAALVCFGFAGLGSARAQDDPDVFLGFNTVPDNGATFSTITESSDSWLYPSSGTAVAGNTNVTWLSFLNNTTTDWTSITIVASMNTTSGHTFMCDDGAFPTHGTGTTEAYSSCTPGTPAATTETFTFSGGAVDPGQYLVFTWNNFPTGTPGLTFDFTAAGPSTAAPETSSILLLGTGVIGLLGLALTRRHTLALNS